MTLTHVSETMVFGRLFAAQIGGVAELTWWLSTIKKYFRPDA